MSLGEGAVYGHTSHCPDALEKSLAAELMLLMLSAAALALRRPTRCHAGIKLKLITSYDHKDHLLAD